MRKVSRKSAVALALLACLALGSLLLMPVDPGVPDEPEDIHVVAAMDLTTEPAEPPREPRDLLFIHHSIGGQLLADRGEKGDRLDSPHPNGGGLRRLLEANNYRVHEMTYGSRLGEDTDLFDWLPKFQNHMDDVLRTDIQDEKLPEGRRNQIVMFKSCFPNNQFVGRGEGEGNPRGPELTEANAKASMRELLGEFAKHPEVLYVYLTAPPIAPEPWPEPRWKWLIKKVLGWPTNVEKHRRMGEIARDFNNWMRSPDGWLKDYPHKNVVTFDYYNHLTDNGASNFSRYPTGGGRDSHPSSEGNSKVAPLLVEFLNRAVHRAGLGGEMAQSDSSRPRADAVQVESGADG